MARVKATTSDLHAKLARGECANFHNGCCQGQTPCTVINGESCQYFADYVQPLLDYPEFAGKYGREAKIAVALNPQSKVIRKRRQAGAPTLALDTPTRATTPKVSAKPTPIAKLAPAPARKAEPAVTTVVSVSGMVRTKALAPSAKQRAVSPARKVAAAQQPELALELTPSSPTKRRGRKR